MWIIKNGKNVVAGLDAEGLLMYAGHAGRSPKTFASEAEAKTWWADAAPTLPPVGEGKIRAEPYDQHGHAA